MSSHLSSFLEVSECPDSQAQRHASSCPMKDRSEGNTKSREPLYQHWPFTVYGYYKTFFFCLLSYHAFKPRLLSFLNSDHDGVFRHLLTTCEMRKPQRSLQGFRSERRRVLLCYSRYCNRCAVTEPRPFIWSATHTSQISSDGFGQNL